MTLQETIIAGSCGCDASELASGLISYNEALHAIMTLAAPELEIKDLTLSQARGRVLANACVASHPLPSFDRSAMDGYAVSTKALQGQGPWTLQVADRVTAGSSASQDIREQTAAQIFTGAPVPDGADAVIMQEKVNRSGDHILINQAPRNGENIRRAGEECAAGTEVLAVGTRLGPREIAACAAIGKTTLSVNRQLKVALLVTGNEVLDTSFPAGQTPPHAMIHDVNAPLLQAEMARPDIELHVVQHVPDQRGTLQELLGQLAQKVDLIVTTGGLSVGEEDHVRPAWQNLGGQITFSGVAIKPGKPVSLGKHATCHWLGLPGNPLAAFLTWQLFGKPLVHRLTQARGHAVSRRQLVLSQPVTHKPGRCEFRPATIVRCDGLGREMVEADTATHSGQVTGLPHRDGVILISGDIDQLPAGALVDFFPFSNC